MVAYSGRSRPQKEFTREDACATGASAEGGGNIEVASKVDYPSSNVWEDRNADTEDNCQPVQDVAGEVVDELWRTREGDQGFPVVSNRKIDAVLQFFTMVVSCPAS